MARPKRSSRVAPPPPEPPTPAPAPPAVPAVPERPALAPQVQLAGRMESGFTETQWLVQRDGNFIQLPELFYHVAAAADGSRTLSEIADVVSAATGRPLTADHVRLIIAAKLIPKGIVAPDAQPGAPAVPARRTNAARPPLGMRLRTRMISPRFIDPITRVLQVLFLPPVLVVVLAVIGVAHGWLYFVHGLAANVNDLLAILRMLPLLVPFNILAAAFHELGHAAALRYGGGQTRGIGAGLYLIYPVFFTDVTDNYRLGRWARVRTDLGGFYFTLIFALGMIGLYLLTGRQIFLYVVLLLNFEILSQSLPYVRFDGYWVLADLTGIPDFFSQMGAFVRAILPLPWWRGYRLPKLKGWVQLIFGVYILVTVPLLVYLLVRLVKSIPQVIAVTWSTIAAELPRLETALQANDLFGVASRGLHLALLALPTGGMLLIVANVGRTAFKALWQWSRPLPARWIVRMLGTTAIAGLVTFLWLPPDAVNVVPLLTRLPHGLMAWREAMWARVDAFAGIYRLGDLGTLVVVTSLGLTALELCFVLFDIVSPAWIWLRRRRQAGKGTGRGEHQMQPAGAAGRKTAKKTDFAGLSRIAADFAQAGTPEQEIRDLLLAAGLDKKSVTLMLETLRAGRAAAQQTAAQQVMVSGAIVGVLGLLITLGAWWAGAGAGTLMVASSVSLVAGVRLLRGLVRQYRGRAGRRRRPRRQLAAWGAAGLAVLLIVGLWGRLGVAPRASVLANARVSTTPRAATSTSQPDVGQASTSGQVWSRLGAAPSATVPSAVQATAPVLTVEPSVPTPTTAAPVLTVEPSVPTPPPATPPVLALEPPLPTPTPVAPPATATAAPEPAPSTASPSAAPAAPQPDGVVLAQTINLRAGPGAEYAVLRQLAANQPLTILGQVAHRDWLEVRLPDGQQGWLSGDAGLVQVNRARSSIPPAYFRPLTGIVQQTGKLTGLGELEIASRAARDALVIVRRGETPVVMAYVRAGESFTMRGIPDGVYTVVTSQGDGWDGRGWTSNEQRNRVEETVRFVTTANQYSVWELNLRDAAN